MAVVQTAMLAGLPYPILRDAILAHPTMAGTRSMEGVMRKLANKVAVVSGASKGIGAEIDCELAAAGASVVVNYATIIGGITRSGGKAVAI